MTLRNPEYMGMSYPDRWKKAVADGKQLSIYIPKFGKDVARIKKGSGIVGEPIGDGKVLVYFEGWVNGAMQYSHLDARGQWEAGVDHAAGRMLTEYPTIAKAIVDEDDLITVGYFHPGNRDDKVRVFDDTSVMWWIG